MGRLTTTQTTTLAVVIDRLIPAGDGGPSATDAGVLRFLHELFDGDRRVDAAALAAGLDGLDAEAVARHQTPMADLSPGRQDVILAAVEDGDVRAAWATDPVAFLGLLVDVTADGYYADTAGRRVPPSWEWIGYDPGANRP